MTAKSVSHVPNQRFFITTPVKIVILNLCTLGTYEVYWMYKNWRILRPDEEKFVTFLRAFLAAYFVFPLLKGLKLPNYKALSVVYLGFWLLGFLPGGWFLLSLPSFLVTAVAQRDLNKRLAEPAQVPFAKRAIIFAIIGVILSLLAIFVLLAPKDAQQSNMQNSSHHTVAKAQNNNSQQPAQTDPATDETSESPTPEQTSVTAPKAAASTPKISTPTTVKTIAPTPTINKVETDSQNGAPLILSTSTLNISLSSFNRLPITISSPDGLPMPMPTGAYNNTPFVFGWDATSGSQPPSKAASWTLVFDGTSGIAPGSYVYHFSAGTSTDNWRTATMHRADLTVNITQ